MRLRRIPIVLALLSIAGGRVVKAAPSSTNLAGRWTPESDDRITDEASRARMAHAPDGFCGDGCRITQDAKTLTVVRDTLPKSPALRFKLDGTDSPNTFATSDGEIAMTSQARVVGDHVAIETDLTRGELHVHETLAVSTRDGTLEVDFHNGGRRGGPDVVHRRIFKARP
jgi:hypothetical protein